jgi:hypothetical protein
MDMLKDISLDVRQLISINEKIHSAVLRGTTLNQDEIKIVRHCAAQLLALTKRKGWRHDLSNSTDTCKQL